MTVDASDEACGKFSIHDKTGKELPVKHGMQIIHSKFGKARVLGVAKNIYSSGFCDGDGSKDVLWLGFEEDEGRATFLNPFTDCVKV